VPELPVVNPGEGIDAGTFGNPVLERVISRYPDAATRDALTSPNEGDPAYVEDVDEFQIFDGSVWQSYRKKSDTSGLVRVFHQETISVATTQGAVASLVVDISSVGLVNLARTNFAIIGFAANAQSTQRFWSIWSASLTSLDLRCAPGQTNPASGNAFARLQIIEFY
jgi:hypothetical protein